jgi:hypothetical protein
MTNAIRNSLLSSDLFSWQLLPLGTCFEVEKEFEFTREKFMKLLFFVTHFLFKKDSRAISQMINVKGGGWESFGNFNHPEEFFFASGDMLTLNGEKSNKNFSLQLITQFSKFLDLKSIQYLPRWHLEGSPFSLLKPDYAFFYLNQFPTISVNYFRAGISLLKCRRWFGIGVLPFVSEILLLQATPNKLSLKIFAEGLNEKKLPLLEEKGFFDLDLFK